MDSLKKKPSDEIGLAKARYEYCLRLYEREQDRRENIERKAQFHLSLITIFLGALLLRLDILTEINAILKKSNTQPILVNCTYASALAFAFFVILSLIGVLLTVKSRAYNPEYPVNPSLMLFNPNGKYLRKYTEAELFRSVAMTYALALESDSVTNNRKSHWLSLTSYSLIAAIFAFALFFGTISYLQLVN